QQAHARRAVAQARARARGRARGLGLKFAGRREDARLLKGEGRFTADWSLPGQLYGHFVRSDRAHAEVISLKKPDGVVVLTAEDVADLKAPPPPVRYPGR